MHSDRIIIFTVVRLDGSEVLVKSSSSEKLDRLKHKGFISSYELRYTSLRKGFDLSIIDVDIDKYRTLKELHKVFVLDTYLKRGKE